MMFIDYDLEPNEVGFLKIAQTDKPHDFNASKVEMPRNTGTSLEIVGFTDTNEALFKLTNRDSDFQQTFGVTLRYYRSTEAGNANVFSPETRAAKGGVFHSLPYSVIDSDISYEQGKFLE
jgi:hypothetical protein